MIVVLCVRCEDSERCSRYLRKQSSRWQHSVRKLANVGRNALVVGSSCCVLIGSCANEPHGFHSSNKVHHHSPSFHHCTHSHGRQTNNTVVVTAHSTSSNTHLTTMSKLRDHPKPTCEYCARPDRTTDGQGKDHAIKNEQSKRGRYPRRPWLLSRDSDQA